MAEKINTFNKTGEKNIMEFLENNTELVHHLLDKKYYFTHFHLLKYIANKNNYKKLSLVDKIKLNIYLLNNKSLKKIDFYNVDPSCIENKRIFKFLEKNKFDLLLNFISKGYGLQFSVSHPNKEIREAVARSGNYLDKLVRDEDWRVRREVARQGYGLHLLVNDSVLYVRAEVARQGYGLDILIKDEKFEVRREVLRQGYGLDILLYDKHWRIRAELAMRQFGLHILVHDSDRDVRIVVAQQGYGLDILLYDNDQNVRAEVARQGYGLDVLIKDEYNFVRQIAAQKKYELSMAKQKKNKNKSC